jgi:hypothetical protein
MKEYANKEIEKLKEDLKNIKKNIADNTDYFNVENLAFEEVKGVLKNYFASKVGSKVVRNEDGSKELEFYCYSDDKEEKLSEDMKFAFEQFKKYKNQELRTDFSTAIFYDYYSLEEAKAYTQQSLESAKVFINRLENVDSYLLDIYKESLDEIKETIKTAQENIDNVTLEPSDLSGVYGKLQYAHEIFELIFEEETEYAYIDPQEYKCDEEKCKKAVKEIVNNFDLKKKIELLEGKLSETKDLDEKINACKAVWYMYDLLGVDPKLKEEIKTQIPQIKENLKKTFLNKLSPETQKSGMEYLTKLAHHYGRDPVPGGEEEAEGSVEGLKRSIEDALKNEDDRWIDEDRPKILQDMEIVQDYLDFEGEVELYSEIEFNCVGSLFTIDDYFSPGWED